MATFAHLSPAERRKVLVIGDSITERGYIIENCGWVAGLAAWYQRSTDVVNRGFSGYTSFLLNAVLPIILPKEVIRRDIIMSTIFLGANDSVFEGEAQHVSVESYAINLQSIIAHLRSINDEMKIVLITPPPVDHHQWQNRHDSSVSKYADVCRELAAAHDLALVDLWEGESKIELSDLCDGLHFGPGANIKTLNAIKAVVKEKFPDIVPEDRPDGLPHLPLHFPHWSEVTGISEAEALSKIESWKWKF